MDAYSTVTQKGQVTIPIEFRRKLGIEQKDRLSLSLKGNDIVLTPLPTIRSLAGCLKSNKKFDKKKARAAYMPDVLAGRI